MPEASVHEDHLARGPEDDVGFSGKVFAVEPVAITKRRHEAADDEFGLGIRGPDRGHVGGAAGRGEFIRHRATYAPYRDTSSAAT